MDTTYPSPLPSVLYYVTRDRVRAGQPPIILKNARYEGSDPSWVVADGRKTPYFIHHCWPTAKEAADKVKEIAMIEIQDAQAKLSQLERKMRRSRTAAESLLVGE